MQEIQFAGWWRRVLAALIDQVSLLTVILLARIRVIRPSGESRAAWCATRRGF